MKHKKNQRAGSISTCSGSLVEILWMELSVSVCMDILFFLHAGIMFSEKNTKDLNIPPQVPIFSPTARRSVRPWATPIAAGCQASCPPMGARVQTTAATSMCLAWTLSRTQRYLKAQSSRLISHSPPLVKRRLSVINISNSTTITTITTFSKTITSATTTAP